MNKSTNFFLSLIMMTLGIVGVSSSLELTRGETIATALTTTFLFSWAWFGRWWFWIWAGGVAIWMVAL